MASPKGNKISQIVRLKQVMQRWRRRCTISTTTTADSDSDSEHHRRRIPSPGSLAVYVGIERRRFVIPTRYLNLPVFRSLLNKAEEEFGFQKTGGLVLPCDVVFFKRLLKTLERNERSFGGLDFDDFIAMFADLNFDDNSASYCKDANNSKFNSLSPLLPKARV